MDRNLLGDLSTDPTLPHFSPEPKSDGMVYVGLACGCGGSTFRLTGWPRAAMGPGGFFWRSVMRVFREARLPMEEGDLAESPLWLPVTVSCSDCERETLVLDGEIVVGRLPVSRRAEPRESLRCRVCRRGIFELVAGEAEDSGASVRADLELVARCRACHRQSRVAWSMDRPSAQEKSIDLLYGRR